MAGLNDVKNENGMESNANQVPQEQNHSFGGRGGRGGGGRGGQQGAGGRRFQQGPRDDRGMRGTDIKVFNFLLLACFGFQILEIHGRGFPGECTSIALCI